MNRVPVENMLSDRENGFKIAWTPVNLDESLAAPVWIPKGELPQRLKVAVAQTI